jgi:hypothetical protein
MRCRLRHAEVRVGDGGGEVEGESADAGPLGFLSGGLERAVTVVAVTLRLIAASAFGPGAADLAGGDLGLDLGCGLFGWVGLVEPGCATGEGAGREERGEDGGSDGLPRCFAQCPGD